MTKKHAKITENGHGKYFFRFLSPPAPMKYKQIKNLGGRVSRKTFHPNFLYLLIKRLKIFGAIFLASIFGKKNTKKSLIFI